MKFPNFFEKAKSFSFNLNEIRQVKGSHSRLVSPKFGLSEGPEVPFAKLIEYHDCTPQIQIGVTAYAELITGTEMQINVEKGQEKAKEFVEKWIADTDFYTKFEAMVNTELICGVGILEKLDEKNIQDVVEVDMSTIIGKKRDEFGNLEYYEQLLENGKKIKLGENTPNKFIEFGLSNYSRQLWSRSLFYALAKTRSVGRRKLLPLVEVLWAIEDAMGAVIVNNAYPLTTVTYDGVDDKELEKEAKKFKNFKPGDKIIQSKKPQIDIFETEPNSKYTDWINHIEKAIELGIKFPHDIMTGDFTSRASSDTSENITLKLARGFQRSQANILKNELFDPLLLQNNFDPDKVKLQVSFTTQNLQKLTPDSINFFAGSGVITKKEARQWLKDNSGMDLDDDAEIIEIPDMMDTKKQGASDDEKNEESFSYKLVNGKIVRMNNLENQAKIELLNSKKNAIDNITNIIQEMK